MWLLIFLNSLFSLWVKRFLIERSSIILSASLSFLCPECSGSNQLGPIVLPLSIICLFLLFVFQLVFVFVDIIIRLQTFPVCLFVACAFHLLFNMAPQSDGLYHQSLYCNSVVWLDLMCRPYVVARFPDLPSNPLTRVDLRNFFEYM